MTEYPSRKIEIPVTQTALIELISEPENKKLLTSIRYFSLPDNYGTCSYCEQNILWVQLFSGKNAPLNFEAIDGKLKIEFHKCKEYENSNGGS